MLREQGRNLHAEFVRLLPAPPQPVRMQRWSLRRVGLWVAVLVAASWIAQNPRYVFDNRQAVQTPLGINSLDCSQPEPLWLMAQSVPSASLVPCVQRLPVGWSVAEVAVNDGRSVLTVNHDRAGARAVVVRLTAACDLAGAVEVTSEQPGARRFLRIDRDAPVFAATRFYTFPGGCVTQQVSTPAASGQQLTAETSSAFGFITRERLRQALSERSDGRLRLDPDGSP